jgi:hypothetical protein
MPAHRIGILPMTPAQRQARHRAKPRQPSSATPSPSISRIPARPRRSATAIATLIDLQDEYRTWRDNLPTNLEGSGLADKLDAIAGSSPGTELDRDELLAIDPPRGFGCD